MIGPLCHTLNSSSVDPSKYTLKYKQLSHLLSKSGQMTSRMAGNNSTNARDAAICIWVIIRYEYLNILKTDPLEIFNAEKWFS